MSDDIIMESENYRGSKGSFGYKEIVLSQLQRVVTNMSKEMRKGDKAFAHPNPATSELAKLFTDTRKEFVNSLNCLHDLLMPKFDKEMKDESKKIYKEIETCKKEEGFNQILKIYRKLFQALCLQLERLGWLESGEVHD